MRAHTVCAFAMALAAQACAVEDHAPFTYEVKVGVPDSITAVEADGVAATFAMSGLVQVSRAWPSYDDALASAPIELTFFAGDVAAHVGRVKPGVCASSPSFACPTTIREGITIYDETGADRDGSYLDFGVGTYTAFSCEGCGGGFASQP